MELPYLLMAPGPVQIPPEITQIMALPMIHHRTPEFEKILVDVLERLPKVFGTHERVFIQTATGSGGMESALVNTLSRGDKVLCVVAGKFGERWRLMAQEIGCTIVSYDVPWGEAAVPAKIQTLLNENPDTRAVLIQACETSTAVLNPVQEIGAIVQKFPETLLIVDAITACGVTPLPMDAWGIDVMVAASQKAFMLPAGLSFLAFSKKSWKFVEAAKTPRFYWDVRAEKKANIANQTHFSSVVPLTRALQKVLDLILVNGKIDGNILKSKTLAKGIEVGCQKLGFQLYAKSPSPSVTALVIPEGIQGAKLPDHLETKYRITVAGGQDSLKGKIVRISSMGHIKPNDILRVIEALALASNDLGGKFSKEQIQAAQTAAQTAMTEGSN
ncbi:MAG: alanine--glyoxylate aminotransferase family protein [Bdellovibrionales bacterium]|nr:alanine--glyoxylate aminotransferase family protein [Bdellovibrionales bacterium]